MCPTISPTSKFTLKLSVSLLKYSHFHLITFQLQFKKVVMTTECHIQTIKLHKIDSPYCSTPWLYCVVIIEKYNKGSLVQIYFTKKNIFFFLFNTFTYSALSLAAGSEFICCNCFYHVNKYFHFFEISKSHCKMIATSDYKTCFFNKHEVVYSSWDRNHFPQQIHKWDFDKE